MPLTPELSATLPRLAQLLTPARHPWWILSGAAVALYGVEAGVVSDIDVLFDPRDADLIRALPGVAQQTFAPNPQFHSAHYLRWAGAPLAAELFAEFSLCTEGKWEPVAFSGQHWIECDGCRVPVPPREELVDLLLRFGRPKDLARATALNPSARSPSRSGSA